MISMFRSANVARSLASRPMFSALHKSFSTSPFLQSGSADLAHQLSKEIEYEVANAPQVPDLVKEFKEKSGWVINDEPGKKEVMMTKTFGSEVVKVYFSTDSIAELEDSEDDGYMQFLAIFTKANQKGALEVQMALNQTEFSVDSVSFYDADTALKIGPQGDFERDELYAGPDYEQLQEELRENFHDFVAERGFDEALAEFIPSYLEEKEQNEYVRWLKNVQEFVKE